MTLREHCTPEKLAAHGVIDKAVAGVFVPDAMLVRALVTLGEPVGSDVSAQRRREPLRRSPLSRWRAAHAR